MKNVGAGLPAKAVYQSVFSVTGTPPSQASQLPHLDWGLQMLWRLCGGCLRACRVETEEFVKRAR
ncbi:hypothetical protein CXQ82_19305 [Pseudomonas sp. S09G 359]|nr:hypothetical protein CXQ82_19305 [Pseudomonas sp. S09G 359]